MSKDEDFVYLRMKDTDGPKVVWVRTGNVRTSVLLARLESRVEQMLVALQCGERLVELR